MASQITAEQLRNARIIASVGRRMGMSGRDILIGLMTALQESGLRNLSYGDRDSLGLFQQRPSAGWGSPSQIMSPEYAAKQFFTRLGQIEGRYDMPLWRAAQSVQISAFPRAYAKHEGTARGILQQIAGSYDAPADRAYDDGQLLGETAFRPAEETGLDFGQGSLFWSDLPEASDSRDLSAAMDNLLDDSLLPDESEVEAPGAEAAAAPGAAATDEESTEGGVPLFQVPDAADFTAALDGLPQGNRVTGMRSAVINLARKFIGKPYVFGANGPSAFDCSGLLEYVFHQMGMKMPRLAYQQAGYGEQTSISNIQAGDLVFWGNSRRTQGNHIALYLGNGMILEAPRPGLSVRIRRLGGWDKDDGAIGVRLDY